MRGTIFDIKELSIHDGPGSRVTVFLKGCPLRCLWCHNPEGLRAEPQLSHKKQLCTNCGACYRPCSHEECRPFGRCLHICPNGCLSVAGEVIEAETLAGKLRQHADLLAMLGGGITAWDELIPLLQQVSAGISIVICTVAAAAICAWLFPIPDEEVAA